MSKVYKVTGDVIFKNSDGEREIDLYEESFNIDDTNMKGSEALAYIKKGLLPTKLKKKLAGFKHVRTCEIVDIKDSKEAPKESKLDELMKKCIENKCMPASINQYKTDAGKINALKKALDVKENQEDTAE